MGVPNSQAAYYDIVDGEEIDAADLNEWFDRSRVLSGKGLAGGLAHLARHSFLPVVDPLQLIPGTGLQVLLGDSNPTPVQWAMVQDVLCDYIPQVPIVVPASDPTNPRFDLIAIQPNNTDTDVFERDVEADDGTVNPQNCFKSRMGIAYTYVQGTPASNPVPPATPAGYTAFAIIHRAATQANVLTTDISIVLSDPFKGFPYQVSLIGFPGGTTTVDAGVTLSVDGSIQIGGGQVSSTSGDPFIRYLINVVALQPIAVTFTAMASGFVTVIMDSTLVGFSNADVQCSTTIPPGTHLFEFDFPGGATEGVANLWQFDATLFPWLPLDVNGRPPQNFIRAFAPGT